MSDCATTCSIFLDLSSCFKRLAVLAAFPHGWSFFGKVGGAKSDIVFFLYEHDENQSYNDVKP